LGAAVIVLSDGRRGLALGLALTTVALAALALAGGDPIAASVLLVGGAVATGRRLRTGPDVWGVMPPGSTPRLVLAIAGGLLALWIATSLMTGPAAPLRFAVLSVVGVMGAHVLMTENHPAAVLTAVAALALSVAVGSALADIGPALSIYVVAAVIAMGASFIRVKEPNGA
jgi:hypothetical protein